MFNVSFGSNQITTSYSEKVADVTSLITKTSKEALAVTEKFKNDIVTDIEKKVEVSSNDLIQNVPYLGKLAKQLDSATLVKINTIAKNRITSDLTANGNSLFFKQEISKVFGKDCTINANNLKSMFGDLDLSFSFQSYILGSLISGLLCAGVKIINGVLDTLINDPNISDNALAKSFTNVLKNVTNTNTLGLLEKIVESPNIKNQMIKETPTLPSLALNALNLDTSVSSDKFDRINNVMGELDVGWDLNIASKNFNFKDKESIIKSADKIALSTVKSNIIDNGLISAPSLDNAQKIMMSKFV